MATSCDFKYTANSAKAWYIKNNLIDKYMNILDLNKFRNYNTKHSVFGRNKFGLKGKPMLFIENANGTKAILNRAMMHDIDMVRYKDRKEMQKAVNEYYETMSDDERLSEQARMEQNDQMFQIGNNVDFELSVVKVLTDISGVRKTIRRPDKKNPYIETNLRKLLSSKGVNKTQIDFIFDYMQANNIDEIPTEDLAVELAANYSFSVEINTVKSPAIPDRIAPSLTINNTTFTLSGGTWYNLSEDRDANDKEIELINEQSQTPTQYYSTLTVPGGTNYAENEISTPLITPSIKGHAQFSTEQGIGWFRSDDLSYSNQKEKETKDFSTDFAESSLLNEESFIYNGDKYELVQEFEPGLGAYTMRTKNGESISHEVFMEALENKRLDFNKTNLKTRRILEVQSDLFQNGRDRSDLVTKSVKGLIATEPEGMTAIGTENPITYRVVKRGNKYSAEAVYEYPDAPEDLAYDTNNGDSFDSFKEFDNKEDADNYLKELKNKIESLQNKIKSIPENQFLQLLNKDNNWVTFFIKSIIQDSAKRGYEKVLFPKGETAAKIEGHETIAEEIRNIDTKLQELKDSKLWQVGYKFGGNIKAFKTEEEAIAFSMTMNDVSVYKPKINVQEQINKLEQQKAELKSQGIEKLKPIEAFYEIKVGNILEKQFGKDNVKTITDEYGNQWREVTITPEIKAQVQNFMLQKDESKTQDSDPEIDAKVAKFIEALGFTIDEKKEIRDRNGDLIDATAKVDMINKLIEVAEGRRKIDTLPEEAAHILTLLLRDNGDALYDELLDGIENTPEYAIVKEQYADAYGDNEALYKLEAAGKIIAKEIVAESKKPIYKKILDAIKRFFGKVTSNPYKKAALMILNNETKNLSSRKLQSSETLFQLSREDIKRKFDDSNDRLEIRSLDTKEIKGDRIYRGLYDTIDRYFDKVNSIFVGTRVTDAQDVNFIKTVGRKRAVEINQSDKSVIARETGTLLHDASAKLIDHIVNGKGDLKAIRDDSRLSDESFNKLYNGIKKLVEQAKNIQKTIDPSAEAQFFIEQKLYDEERDVAGSADLIVLFSDSSAAVYDFKFKMYNSYNSTRIGGVNYLTKDIVGLDAEDSYEMQMSQYVEMLQEIYGITTVRQSRVVPAAISYGYDSVEKKFTDRVVQLDIGIETSEFLAQVPLAKERPSVESLSKALESQLRFVEKMKAKLNNAKDYDTKQSIRLLLEKRDKAIKALILEGRASEIFNDIYSVIERVYGDGSSSPVFANNDESSPDFMNYNDLNELKEELLLYKLFLKETRMFMNELREADEKTYQIYFDHSAKIAYKIELTLSAIQDKVNERAVNDAKKHGYVEGKPNRALTWWERNLATFSEQKHPLFKTAQKHVDDAQTRKRNKVNKLHEDLTTLHNSLLVWGKANGYHGAKVFQLLIEGDNKNLVSKFDKKLFKDRDAAIERKDVSWLKEHFELRSTFLPTLERRRENFKKSLLMRYPDGVNPVNGEKISREKIRDLELSRFDEVNDPSKDTFWLDKRNTSNNIRLKKEYFEKYYSTKYKFIKANKPLLDYYNFYISKNEEFRSIIGYDNKRGIPDNFVANINEGVLDSIVMGNRTFGAAAKSMMSSLSIHQDGSMGQINPDTGEIEKSIPIFFTNPLRNASGEVDYTNKSTDLSKSLMLFADSVYNYEQMHEIEAPILALRDVLETDLNGELHTDVADRPMRDRFKRIVTKKASDRTIDAYNKFMNYYLYGQKIQSKDRSFKLFGMDLSSNKLLSAAKNYYSLKVLGLAVIPPAAAFSSGAINIFFEGSKKLFFSNSDVRRAMGKLAVKDNISWMYGKYFEVYQENLIHRKANNLSASAISKTLTLENMMRTFSFADEMLDNIVINAMVDTHGIDRDGNILHISKLPFGSKTIRERSKIINDKLVIDGLTESGFQSFRNKVKYIGGSMKGQMSEEDINLAGTSMLGSLVMQFKNWMPRLVTERFGSLRYVEATQSFHQGRYSVVLGEVFSKDREFADFGEGIGFKLGRLALSSLFFGALGTYSKVNVEKAKREYLRFKGENRDITSVKNMTFEEFLDMKNAQMRAAMFEIRATLIIMALIMFLGADWDDDGEKEYKRFWVTRTLKRVLDRAQSELSFYYNPMEVKTWIRGPLPLAGMADDIINGFRNLSDESIDLMNGRKDPYDKTPFGYYGLDFIPGVDKLFGLLEVWEQDKNK